MGVGVGTPGGKVGVGVRVGVGVGTPGGKVGVGVGGGAVHTFTSQSFQFQELASTGHASVPATQLVPFSHPQLLALPEGAVVIQLAQLVQ